MGKIEKIIPRTRNDAHRLIEECMLAANVCAADLLIRHKHPGTFRIHATPTEEKLNQLRTFLKMTGLNLGGGLKPTAGDYAALMREIKERPDASLLQTMLLRSMQQAVYSPDNVGHFGLAYEAYAHFTSPIRRYPDLLTHRAIKAVLQGKKYEPKGIDLGKLNTTVSNAARKQAAKDRAEGTTKDAKDLTIWDALGVHCSANERRADEASRDVENWLKCFFMQDKLGESFTGTVAGVTTFGIFVQLDELYVEGLVHVTGLGQDYFQYDEARHQLRGERTGKTFGLTDRVTVQVAKVDLEARKIDLVLADEAGAEAAQPGEEQTRGRQGARGGEGKSDRSRNANGGGQSGAPAQPQASGAAPEEEQGGRSKRSRRSRKDRAAAAQAREQANTVPASSPAPVPVAAPQFDASIEPDSSENARRARQSANAKAANAQARQRAADAAGEAAAAIPSAAPAGADAPGAKRRSKKDKAVIEAPVQQPVEAVSATPAPVAQPAVVAAQTSDADVPKAKRPSRAKKTAAAEPSVQPEAVAEVPVAAKRARRPKAAEPVAVTATVAAPAPAPAVEAPAKPRRSRAAKAEAAPVESAAEPKPAAKKSVPVKTAAKSAAGKPAAKKPAAKPAAKAASTTSKTSSKKVKQEKSNA
ncbi:MAG: rnr [Massilia sp.]|nr:rnr [Massilia sp.]